MEFTTVRLETEPNRRKRNVSAGHDPATHIPDRVLKDHLWQRRIVEAKRKQLLEPTRRQPSFPRNRVEKSEQHATSGLTGPVAPFGGRPGLDEIESRRSSGDTWCTTAVTAGRKRMPFGTEISSVALPGPS